MDAYCQAIESFWGKKATTESKQYALEAIQICRDWLEKAVLTDDKEANEQMAKAAHISGKAINISRTTAPHALSYTITSEYGIPHGHAVALTIAQVFKANLGYIKDENILINTLGIEKDNILSYFRNLMTAIGLEYDFAKLGITNFDMIVNSVNVDRLGNNPRSFSYENLLNIF